MSIVNTLTKNEAVGLLSACRYLTTKLALQGVELKLTNKDRAALRGFRRVWLVGWDFLDDPDVPWEAGLSSSDVERLRVIMAKHSVTFK